MEIIRDLNSFSSNENICVALGNFDGVHLGHQALIKKLVQYSKSQNCLNMIFTFEPHPIKVLNPEKAPYLLTTLKEKIEIFKKEEIDILFLTPFNKTFSKIEPEEFVTKILIEKLKIKCLVVGFDYRFGHKGRGDTEMLKYFSKLYGFQLTLVPPVFKDGLIVSSSMIRQFIQQGKVMKAMEFLGRSYKLSGKVIHGDGIGKRLGFPTANIDFNKSKIRPANGVYLIKAKTENETLYGISNIGIKPTFEKNNIILEVHLFDFDRNIYEEPIEVEFLKKIRDERKFRNVHELKNRIKQDISIAKAMLSKF